MASESARTVHLSKKGLIKEVEEMLGKENRHKGRKKNIIVKYDRKRQGRRMAGKAYMDRKFKINMQKL